MSAEEDYVKEALDYAGLPLVARNHVMRRPDGSIEVEVDMVYAHEGYTFVIEVSANSQRDARRRKRKRLREWHAGDLFARLSSGLGLPASNRLRTVYVDLSRDVQEGEDPCGTVDGIVMGKEHIDELASGPPGRSLSVFLEWCKIPHDPKTGHVVPPEGDPDPGRREPGE